MTIIATNRDSEQSMLINEIETYLTTHIQTHSNWKGIKNDFYDDDDDGGDALGDECSH